MVGRMIESTSSFNNVHRVIDNNSNPYRNMGHVSQCPIVNEESNCFP